MTKLKENDPDYVNKVSVKILQEIENLATKAHVTKPKMSLSNHSVQFQTYEIPKGIVLDFEGFTPANGKLTSTSKPCKREIVACHKKELEALFNKLDNNEQAEQTVSNIVSA